MCGKVRDIDKERELTIGVYCESYISKFHALKRLLLCCLLWACFLMDVSSNACSICYMAIWVTSL